MDFINEFLNAEKLLPNSHKMRVKELPDALKVITTLERLLFSIQEGLNCLMASKFNKFDALIGENSCQIRAYLFQYLWQNNQELRDSAYLANIFLSIENALVSTQETIISLKTNKQDLSNNKFTSPQGMLLSDFLASNNVLLNLDKKLFIFFICYFLAKYTLVNNQGIHFGINYLKMCTELNFSKTLARRIVHLYQTEISKISYQFIKFLANEISFVKSYYAQAIDSLTFIDDDGRTTLPCFLSMRIILEHLYLSNGKIKIKIYKQNTDHSNKSILYEQSFSATLNHQMQKIIEQKKYPSVTFRGVCDENSFKESQFEEYPYNYLEQCILASTANHPQYPGKKLFYLRDEPFKYIAKSIKDTKLKQSLAAIQNEFSFAKQWAQEVGCSLVFPKMFFITHIYAS